MKKQLLVMLSICFWLAGCQSQPLQLEKIDDVPRDVDQLIMYDKQLQLITSDANGTYIAIYASSPLEAAFDVIDRSLQVHFNKTGKPHAKPQLYVYALTRGDAKYEAIEVYINNELVPFDVVTTF